MAIRGIQRDIFFGYRFENFADKVLFGVPQVKI